MPLDPAPPFRSPTPTLSSCNKFLLFLRSELSSPKPEPLDPDDEVSDAQVFAAKRREKVYTFVSIPKELEKLMGYGFFQCADAFLHVFTFLPLRCAVAWYDYLHNLVSNRSACFKSSDKCEMLKIMILVFCSWSFTYIDTNVLYHVIKSQSVIKLYIFFNMLEVGDRLFGCFSQDTLDALFITATEQETRTEIPESPSSGSRKAIKKLSTTTHAFICGLSILGHALVILLQSTTLSVAINANNRALLTVMMSNNFVELKGAVFKKFDKMNLFQVTCSDIRERFHLFVLLLIVCLQTLREYSWEESRFWVLLPDCLMVLLAEIGVDWIKHAFITRFNELPLTVYENYTRSLAYDMAESVKRKSTYGGFGDYSDVVGRRLGFVPLPLAIVLIRVISPMWRINSNVVGVVVLSILGYVALASFRVLNLIVLVGKAVRIIDEHAGREAIAEENEKCVKNSILKRTRTISGSDGDLLTMKEFKPDKKLQFQEDLKHEGELQKNYLLANSNVSIYSVGFNEEMIRVEKEQREDLKVSSFRKHSLGSNIEGELLFGLKLAGDPEKREEMPVKLDEDIENVFGDNLNDTVMEVKQEGLLDVQDIKTEVIDPLLGGGDVKLEDVAQEHVPEAVEKHEEGSKIKAGKKLINWFK
ncbi:Protein TAPT1 [Orchesella cincta]|uniref:Protein TAPT1 n=1 Tax=Orchesella cincta TaxID=48709 RepID=A0A1D2MT20_ORCCI|nr:Protein TAPT1 [Orchesella cincta]